MDRKTRINGYLFTAFEFDENKKNTVSENWPFELHCKKEFKDQGSPATLYSFTHENTEYFAIDSDTTSHLPTCGMSEHAIEFQLMGNRWIKGKIPIGMHETRNDHPSLPSVDERAEAITTLAAGECNGKSFEIIEGYYLEKDRTYLAIITVEGSATADIVGNKIHINNIPFSDAPAWRRLCVGIGQLVKVGLLN